LINVLFRSKAVDILLALYEEPLNIRPLIRKVGGSATTIEQRIRELVKEGLIKEKASKQFPFRKTLELTDKGKEVAEKLLLLRSTFTNELPLKRMKWPLLILYIVNKIKGKTKLQKLVFLLDKELKIIKDHKYNFIKYRYGPFSKELIQDIEILILAGFINIEEEIKEINGEEITIPIYTLTARGQKIAQKIYNNLTKHEKEKIEKLNYYNKMTAKELTQYVHQKYPQYVLSSDNIAV